MYVVFSMCSSITSLSISSTVSNDSEIMQMTHTKLSLAFVRAYLKLSKTAFKEICAKITLFDMFLEV